MHDVHNTGNCLGFVGVEAHNFSAKDRRARDHRRKHAGNVHIQSELRRAVSFRRSIQAMHGLADQREILRILQRNIFRRLDFGCGVREAAIGSAPAAGRVDHVALLGVAGLRIHIPGLRGGGDEHHARHCAHLAEAIVFGVCSGAAAGHHHAEDGVVVNGLHRRRLHADLGPIGFEFFVQQHRKRCVNSLAHFRVIGDHGDGFRRR